MPRSQGVQKEFVAAALLLLGIMTLVAPEAHAAVDRVSRGAIVAGVVRDAQGVAQMGALVQVLAANSATVATAFTDQHGRYSIANLNSGKYIVRASATLFVPATKGNLQLRTGVTSVVNLTLAALFDTASWLPAERRHADETDDDWKWTLRSTANRPILRVLDHGTTLEVSTSAAEKRPVAHTRVRETVASGDGGFGSGGVHNILTLHRSLDDGGDMLLRADVGTNRVPAAYGSSQEFDAGYERRTGVGGAARTVVSYKAHPELVASGVPGGLVATTVTSGERMVIGDRIEVEAGGELEGVHASQYAFATHPFLRVSGHPGGEWILEYRMATDPGLQEFEDVSIGSQGAPVALVKNGKLTLASGRHQEVSVARKVGHGTVQATIYHDALGQVAVSGGGAPGPGEIGATVLPAEMLVDPTTGSFRTLANGFSANGVRITMSAPLADGLWIAAEYSNGRALASRTGGLNSFDETLSGMKAESAQSATVAVKGRIAGSGTRVRASYRWQPSRFVTAIDPYSALADQAFLSCMLRQPIRWGGRLPKGLDATIDVTNLLAEGYRPFVSADGQTLYFAQAPRTIQAGLSFTF